MSEGEPRNRKTACVRTVRNTPEAEWRASRSRNSLNSSIAKNEAGRCAALRTNELGGKNVEPVLERLVRRAHVGFQVAVHVHENVLLVHKLLQLEQQEPAATTTAAAAAGGGGGGGGDDDDDDDNRNKTPRTDTTAAAAAATATTTTTTEHMQAKNKSIKLWDQTRSRCCSQKPNTATPEGRDALTVEPRNRHQQRKARAASTCTLSGRQAREGQQQSRMATDQARNQPNAGLGTHRNACSDSSASYWKCAPHTTTTGRPKLSVPLT